MIRFPLEDCAIDRAIDRHGIHVVGGPLLVGGVDFLTRRTGFCSDFNIRRVLTDERFRAYLEFREQAFEIAMTELMSGALSPVDLFLLVAADTERFQYELRSIMLRYTRHDGTSSILQQSVLDDDGHKGTEVDHISIMHYLPKDTIRKVEDEQKSLHRALCAAQRYFAYRKLLVKLDFIQLNSDPEEVLKRLKSSRKWSRLKDRELRCCIESHIDFLKEYEKSKLDQASSISEYADLALEKISSELSSELHDHLDNYDWLLMEGYYDRMKLRRLARECATQAEMTGVILVGEALPIREHLKKHMLSANPEITKLPLIKQAVKQSLEGYMGRLQEKFRSGAARGRPWQLLALTTFATLATVGIKTKR